MAQNVFDASLERNNSLNRNPFDWSHVWNGTTQHGTITPVFCELVPQKHSIRINPEFGLELMPMVFPVQTRQFARINFFKIPLRALYEDYMDFISNYREDLEEPYILPNEQQFKDMLTTGSLGDYLNIPTRGVSSSSSVNSTISSAVFSNPSGDYSHKNIIATTLVPSEIPSKLVYSGAFLFDNSAFDTTGVSSSVQPLTTVMVSLAFSIPQSINISDVSSITFTLKGFASSPALHGNPFGIAMFQGSKDGDSTREMDGFVSYKFLPNGGGLECTLNLSDFDKSYINDVIIPSASSHTRIPIVFAFQSTEYFVFLASSYSASGSINVDTVVDEETTYQTTPFATLDNPDNLRLLAYKFRAYEAVYNAFYRDVRNDPFIVDGRPVYNKWLPTMKGGADTTSYRLHQCNWERDVFTTCIPSPQQGRAPLAGLTVYDAVTTNEDGSYTIKKATALVTEDGSKYGITYKTSEDGEVLESVDYEPLSDKTEVTPIRSAMDLVNSGLSIETLRMTNAYQKYLELNMRKSFTYKAIMEGRYDVNLRFDELLMPEFFGGVSRELSMNVAEQAVDKQTTPDNGLYKDALGSKAGISGVYGNTSNNIECFCDEESIVIGLLTVTPVPIYTQMLPKDFTYRSVLDHWAPEFSSIGYQPVTYKEMCPLNVANQEDVSRLEETFGYQRPWYEHVAKYDTAHGLFRSDMNGFLMTRFFKGFPELGGRFLKVDPEVVNQVFSVTEFTHKIFGYVKFNCVVQSPIPRVSIPRID